MNSCVQQTLQVVRSLLSGPGGPKAALSFLERRSNEQLEVQESAIVWACLSDLRAQTGDSNGAREAAERASLLRSAPVRTLSFDEIESLTSLTSQPKIITSTPSSWMHVRTPVKNGKFPMSSMVVHDALKKARRLGEKCRDLLGDDIVNNVKHVHEPQNARGDAGRALRRSAAIGKRTAALLERDV